MSDDVNPAAPSPAESTTATTPVTVETPAAEPQNTEQPQSQEHMIPKSRLDEVIGQKKDALREKEELAARVQELESQVNKPEPVEQNTEPVRAPEHLSQEQQVQWLIEHHSKAYIEKELGMPLKTASTLLSTTKSTTQDLVQQKWDNMCSKHNLDPQNQEVQEMVAGLTHAKVPLETAFERASKFYGKAPATTDQQVATVEDSTTSPVMTNPRRIPESVREAVEMAERGEKAPFESSADIIQRGLEKAKAAAKG